MDGLEGRALSLRFRRTFGVCVVGVGRVSCVASSRVVSLGVVEAFTVVSVQLVPRAVDHAPGSCAADVAPAGLLLGSDELSSNAQRSRTASGPASCCRTCACSSGGRRPF